MRKLSVEVNDTEICKRLEILMATSKDDLPIAQVNLLLADPKSFDPRAIAEPFTQYVRHFIYMVKRSGKLPADLAGDSSATTGNNRSQDTAKSKKLISAKKTNPRPKKSLKTK